jgi:hypothetical protein
MPFSWTQLNTYLLCGGQEVPLALRNPCPAMPELKKVSALCPQPLPYRYHLHFLPLALTFTPLYNLSGLSLDMSFLALPRKSPVFPAGHCSS